MHPGKTMMWILTILQLRGAGGSDEEGEMALLLGGPGESQGFP